MSDCIIIINREEENGRLEERTGSDIVEYMERTCDYLFGREPELIREVHKVMEPVIKLAREEAEDEIKLIREEAKQMERQLIQKDIEIKRICEENEKQQGELKSKRLAERETLEGR